ncbi:MAG: hypothetical protein HKN43_00365 [Rhodothermales bacterium]|nr:hypothetical protein [Rhodothermales bacterium]
MKAFSTLLLLPLFVVALLLTGCDSTVTGEGETTTVTLFLQPVFDGAPLSSDLSTVYDLNGTAISFTSARMYISEIELVKADGSTVPFETEPITVPAKDANDNDITHTVTDKIVLVKHDLGTHKYVLGDVESGEYTGVRYKVGIAGTTNRVDASQVPANHPLAKQTDRNNHWSWSAGYQFVRVDGLVDSDSDGTPDEVWETHLGTANFLTDVESSLDFDLTDEEAVDVHIMLDYKSLMQDVDLSDPDQRLCHTADNLPVANKVGSRISSSLMLHGVHESTGSGH